MLDYELEANPGNPIYDIPDFTLNEEKAAPNFSNGSVLGLGLGPILNLDLLKLRGPEKQFYRVPDDEVINVGLLGLIGISIGDGDRFNTVEGTPVIATRAGTLLGLNLLGNKEQALVKINVLTYKNDDDTNVLINGSFTPFKLIGEVNKYERYLF